MPMPWNTLPKGTISLGPIYKSPDSAVASKPSINKYFLLQVSAINPAKGLKIMEVNGINIAIRPISVSLNPKEDRYGPNIGTTIFIAKKTVNVALWIITKCLLVLCKHIHQIHKLLV